MSKVIAFINQFFAYHALPSANVRCRRCQGNAWARPERVLIARAARPEGNEYARTSGHWVICTHCIPPARWVEFFTKYDTLESEAEPCAKQRKSTAA